MWSLRLTFPCTAPQNVQAIGLLLILIFSLQQHTYVNRFNQNHFTNYKKNKSVNNNHVCLYRL
jgi:hypothetical protein